jgi:hypothetical protein
MSRRGTVHRNATGNSYDRRARRDRIWRKYARKGWIKCHHCPRKLRKRGKLAFEVDRFPICGHAGGRYIDDNTVPSCPKCNRDRCTNVCGKGVAAKKLTAAQPQAVAA